MFQYVGVSKRMYPGMHETSRKTLTLNLHIGMPARSPDFMNCYISEVFVL
jgi:hypothetical protein